MILKNLLVRPHSARLGLLASKSTFPKSTGRALRHFSADPGNAASLPQSITFDTLHELQTRACDAYANNDVFGTYSPASGKFEYMTYQEFGNEVNRCRALLKQAGIGQYDKVAIISNNRWEWVALSTAAYSLSASFVPMYEAQLSGDWTYILNDSGSSVVFCATQSIYDRVQKEVLPSAPGVQAAFCLDAPQGEPHAFATAMAAVEADTDGSLIIPPTPEDLANLIYTSGTTGKPKGVELMHSNSSTNVQAPSLSPWGNASALVSPSDRTLAFLPWAHSYGQTCELYTVMSKGGSMGICRGVPMILEDLQLVKPTVLYAVPTLYKKVYDGVHNIIESASPLRKSLMRSALSLGEARANYEAGKRGPLGPLDRIRFSMLDRIVLSKIRDRFGGNLRYGGVAGAACPPEVINFMDSIGIPVCEGYGLTETSPIISLNFPTCRKVGSVGRPIYGVTVYIIDEDGKPLPPGEEGEICCVGPNVMKGYYNNPDATAEAISVGPDGKSRMFHTGDIGKLDEDGWLRVTGRLKEQYKLENGKYVVPTPVELALGVSRFISQVVLYGANRPYNIALIVPDWGAIRAELGCGDDVTEDDLANDERVKSLMDNEIAVNMAGHKKFEIPTKWAFVAPFTAANDMLTPKMSIRRHKVVEAYSNVIAMLYGENTANEGSQQEVA